MLYIVNIHSSIFHNPKSSTIIWNRQNSKTNRNQNNTCKNTLRQYIVNINFLELKRYTNCIANHLDYLWQGSKTLFINANIEKDYFNILKLLKF
jgi:hypothetical protein